MQTNLFLLVALTASWVVTVAGAGEPRGNKDGEFALQRRAVVLGALVADAACLGSQHEMDLRKLAAAHKRHPTDQYLGPEIPAAAALEGQLNTSVYSAMGKESGDNTNHGDANRMLLEWLALTHEEGGFDVELYVRNHLAARFGAANQDANADLHAREVAERVDGGVQLHLAGNPRADQQIVRCAGAFAVFKELEELKQVCGLTTQFTHGGERSLKASIFWAEITWRVIYHAETPADAIENAMRETDDQWIERTVGMAMAKVKEVKEYEEYLAAVDAGEPSLDLKDDILSKYTNVNYFSQGKDLDEQAIKSLGTFSYHDFYGNVGMKTNRTEGALAATVYLILQYPNDFKEAVRKNVLIGGDSASRAIPLGMVLGAHLRLEEAGQHEHGVPMRMIRRLTQGNFVKHLLDELPLTSRKHFSREHILRGHGRVDL